MFFGSKRNQKRGGEAGFLNKRSDHSKKPIHKGMKSDHQSRRATGHSTSKLKSSERKIEASGIFSSSTVRCKVRRKEKGGSSRGKDRPGLRRMDGNNTSTKTTKTTRTVKSDWSQPVNKSNDLLDSPRKGKRPVLKRLDGNNLSSRTTWSQHDLNFEGSGSLLGDHRNDRSARSLRTFGEGSERYHQPRSSSRTRTGPLRHCIRRSSSDSTCSLLSMEDPCFIRLQDKRGRPRKEVLALMNKKGADCMANEKFVPPKEIIFKRKERKPFRESVEI